MVSALNDLPVRAADRAVVVMKDVAKVRLGYAARKHCASRTESVGAADGFEEWRNVDAGHREEREADAAGW